MMQSSRKPPLPLPRSPIQLRLRPRRPLQSTSTYIQTPPGSLMKSPMPKSCGDNNIQESDLRPEYRTISCELRALAKMVHQEFSGSDMAGDDDAGLVGSLTANRSPLFERGRFYEEYSARRNERLRRKKGGEMGDGKKGGGYDLGVRVESAKRRETSSSKRFESLRKTIPCTPISERSQTAAAAAPPSSSRYLLRSSTSKENKKPPPVVYAEKKTVVRRTRKN